MTANTQRIELKGESLRRKKKNKSKAVCILSLIKLFFFLPVPQGGQHPGIRGQHHPNL
jgi:hypothetical protein